MPRGRGRFRGPAHRGRLPGRVRRRVAAAFTGRHSHRPIARTPRDDRRPEHLPPQLRRRWSAATAHPPPAHSCSSADICVHSRLLFLPAMPPPPDRRAIDRRARPRSAHPAPAKQQRAARPALAAAPPRGVPSLRPKLSASGPPAGHRPICPGCAWRLDIGGAVVLSRHRSCVDGPPEETHRSPAAGQHAASVDAAHRADPGDRQHDCGEPSAHPGGGLTARRIAEHAPRRFRTGKRS